jgi:LysR family glycine cleavage system transcriptional activator
MERLPSIQTLRAFDAAARHGNYSAAAEELGLTHGAISHRIRELEDRLGASLFQRRGRVMAPTPEAVTLLAQVRQALALLRQTFPTKDEKATSLVVSLHPSLATCWLVARLGRFAAAHPNIELEIRSTADLGDFITPGVDVAIRYGGGGWPNVSAEALAGEVLFPICTPAYRDDHRLRQPGDLARCALLRHAWQPWSPWLRAAGLRLAEPTEGVVLSDSAMLIEAAASGQGVGLAAGLMVQDALASGRLVRPFETAVDDVYSYFLTWRAGKALGAPAIAFRDWLLAELEPAL